LRCHAGASGHSNRRAKCDNARVKALAIEAGRMRSMTMMMGTSGGWRT
jgi:hypothetical protein